MLVVLNFDAGSLAEINRPYCNPPVFGGLGNKSKIGSNHADLRKIWVKIGSIKIHPICVGIIFLLMLHMICLSKLKIQILCPNFNFFFPVLHITKVSILPKLWNTLHNNKKTIHFFFVNVNHALSFWYIKKISTEYLKKNNKNKHPIH